MEKEIVNKRFNISIIFMMIISVAIFCGCIRIQFYLKSNVKRTCDEKLEVQAQRFQRDLSDMVRTEQQILQTLATFIEHSSITEADDITNAVYQTNLKNDFLIMGYIKPDYTGVLTSMTGDIEYIDEAGLNPVSKELIERAFKGESGISDMFYSEYLKAQICIYAVPVYQDGKVAGVLTASKMNVFSGMSQLALKEAGNSSAGVLSQEGEILIRSKKRVVTEPVDSLFEGPYLNKTDAEYVRKQMENYQSVRGEFRYNGENFRWILYPIGINGWYIFCVNSLEDIDRMAFFTIKLINAFFIVINVALFIILFMILNLFKKEKKHLSRLAYKDALTGARNSAWFHDKLAAVKENLESGSIIVMNIKNFKFINDIYGKAAADKLLCDVKEIIEQNLLAGEFFCRENADQFAIFMTTTDKYTVRQRLLKIVNEIGDHTMQGKFNYKVSMYCGVNVINGYNKINSHESVVRAMFALQAARQMNNDRIWFYNKELYEREKLDNYIEMNMERALEEGEFRMYLQPKIDLEDRELCGAEVLVRWVQSDGKMIYPDQFIPKFESNGFCVKLDLYMFECACKQIRKWQDEGKRAIPLSVNQSKLLFYERDYVDMLYELTRKYGVEPKMLTLEILEGLAASDTKAFNEKIGRLREKGFRVSMDDFGSGYSSLNVLGHITLDELKLDRAFLMELTKEDGAKIKAIMESVVKLTKRMGISTVVEGVETEENHEFIKQLGCNIGQGYLYSRPISSEEFNDKFMS